MPCMTWEWGYFEKKPDVFPARRERCQIRILSLLQTPEKRRDPPARTHLPEDHAPLLPWRKGPDGFRDPLPVRPDEDIPSYPVLGSTDPTGYPIRAADASRPGISEREKCRDFPSPFILFTYNSFVVTRSTLEPGAGI